MQEQDQGSEADTKAEPVDPSITTAAKLEGLPGDSMSEETPIDQNEDAKQGEETMPPKNCIA